MANHINVPVIGSVKYKKQFFNRGDIIQVLPSDVESLIKDGVISREDVPETTEEDKPLEKMKLEELKDYAFEHAIDFGDATKKEEVLAAILKAGEANGNGGAS